MSLHAEGEAAGPANRPKVPGRVELTAQPGEAVNELSLEQAFRLAVTLHQKNFVEAARELYGRILAAAPDHPDALHFSGVATHQLGDTEEGIRRIRAALALQPGLASAWNNLGNILLVRGRTEEAGEAYERCLTLSPEDADIHNNLALLRRAQGRLEEAEAAMRRAIALRPDYLDAYNNLGNLLCATRRVPEAVRVYSRACTFAPNNPQTRKNLAFAHIVLGEVDKAEAIYRQWLAEEPDNPLPAHYLAACSGSGVPERASDGYVKATFDSFAESFDAKLGHLLYRAPELVGEEVARLCGRPAGSLDILDAGCGTGLCGPRVAPWARRLVGVDLSSEMIARAKGREYDELCQGELTAFLAGRTGSADLVISADTLCYFGRLEGAAAAAFAALRPGGRLIFTVEADPPSGPDRPDYRLQANGRYAHSRDYVRRSLEEAGFGEVSLGEVHLRMEAGLPVNGLLVSASRPAATGAAPRAETSNRS